MTVRRFCLLALSILIAFSAFADADWFDTMHPTGDTVYIRLDSLTGTSMVTEMFTTNVSAEAYLKVLGQDSDPWMMPESGWSIDLYLRPTVTSSWTQVASGVTSSFPSDRIMVTAGVAAEMQAVAYYPPRFEATLTSPLLPNATRLYCDGHAELPSRGVIDIEGEYIKYAGKTTDGLTGLTRGHQGTIARHHTSGTTVKLFSGTFEIPIIIAIDTGTGDGSGGALHPSRCHRMEITITQGTPPVALFRYTCWYNQVTVNASSSYDPDGTIVGYQWDWTSDGIYDDMGMEATHSYPAVGSYSITLRVTDNDGMTDTITHLVTPRAMIPESNGGILSFFTTPFYGIPLWGYLIAALIIILLLVKGVAF